MKKPGVYILPKNPLEIGTDNRYRSDGKIIYPGYDAPYDELPKSEQQRMDREIAEAMRITPEKTAANEAMMAA